MTLAPAMAVLPDPESATLLVTSTRPSEVLAAITELVRRHGGRMLEAEQHAEQEGARSFLRLRWDGAGDRAELRGALGRLARIWELDWSLRLGERRPRVAVLASKAPHCLQE